MTWEKGRDVIEIAYDALYAAARKALTAVLQQPQQGLRPTQAGGNEAVIYAAEAQLIPPLRDVLKPFRLMRRTRGSGDYLAATRAAPQMSVFTPTR